jgi:hypothetical protein
MRCQLWCGLCYEGLRGRRSHRGHSGVQRRPQQSKGGHMSILGSKGDSGKATPGSYPDLSKDEWAIDTPGLWEYLTAWTYADGSQRVTSTLTVFLEEGMVKVCLNDRDKGRVAFVSGRTVTKTLEALEEGLQEGSLDWRAQRKVPRAK